MAQRDHDINRMRLPSLPKVGAKTNSIPTHPPRGAKHGWIGSELSKSSQRAYGSPLSFGNSTSRLRRGSMKSASPLSDRNALTTPSRRLRIGSASPSRRSSISVKSSIPGYMNPTSSSAAKVPPRPSMRRASVGGARISSPFQSTRVKTSPKLDGLDSGKSDTPPLFSLGSLKEKRTTGSAGGRRRSLFNEPKVGRSHSIGAHKVPSEGDRFSRPKPNQTSNARSPIVLEKTLSRKARKDKPAPQSARKPAKPAGKNPHTTRSDQSLEALDSNPSFSDLNIGLNNSSTSFNDESLSPRSVSGAQVGMFKRPPPGKPSWMRFSSVVVQSQTKFERSLHRSNTSFTESSRIETKDKEPPVSPTYVRRKFLEPETYIDNCGVLASAVLEYSKLHRIPNKKSIDDFAISVAKDSVSKRVAHVAEALALKLQGVELIRGAVRWLCHFVRGTPGHLRHSEIKQFDYHSVGNNANRILAKGVANSYEFAVLLMALLKEVNIASLVVVGYGRHMTNLNVDRLTEPNHCWNLVRLPDYTWRCVDVAMCSGSWHDGTMMAFYDTYLFLQPQQFVWQHLPVKALGHFDLLLEIKESAQLQMLVPQVNPRDFWEWPLVSTEYIEGHIFLNPSSFVKALRQNRMKYQCDIACNFPSEIQAKLMLGDKSMSECVMVRPSSTVLQKSETAVAMFKLKAVFPHKGVYKLSVFSRRVSSSTYKMSPLFSISIEALTGVFEHHTDTNMCVGFLKDALIFEEKVRDIIRNTTVSDPADSFHFIRSPFIINLFTPPEVTRVAYVSNVFWTFLKHKLLGNPDKDVQVRKRYFSTVIIDRTGTFAVYFEIGGRFVRSLEFLGQRWNNTHKPTTQALRSSKAAGQHFLFDIKDDEKKKKVHNAITKCDGDLDMDQYGRCISAELQVRRITKESFTIIFDLRCRKEWSLQAICFEGWHNKSTPLPGHHIEVESVRRPNFEHQELSSSHGSWRITFKLPEKEGQRYSMQFNLCLSGSQMYRYAMTYHHTAKEGHPMVENFEFR